MNDSHLRYLKAINRQLGGPIGKALGNDMAGRLLFCSHHLLSSLIAEQENPNAPASTAEIAQLLSRLGRDQQAAAVLAERIASDRCYWQGLEQAFNSASSAEQEDREVAPLSDAEQQRLLDLLRKKCGEGESLAIATVRAVAGGFSKQTIILGLRGNQRLPEEIVVRRDRAESPVGSTVLDEFELLATLHGCGLTVPRPLAVASEVMGCPILVMEKAAGGNIGDVYNIHAPATVSPLLANSLAAELARLHSIPLQQLPASLPGTDSTHKPFLRQEIETFQRDWQSLGESSLTIDLAFHWLFAHLDQLDERRCLVHRDTRFHNILSQGEQLTALLDWELAAIGHPARDLGYAYHHINQFADWQEFLAAYEAAGGSRPSELELDFYILWSDLFVAIYMYRARQSYLSGSGENIQLAYAGERLRQHNMYLLAQRLQEVLEKHPLAR